MRFTVTELAAKLHTEADAYEFMESLRWPDGPICPHCGCEGATFVQPTNGVSRKTRTGAMSERRVWRCAGCRKQFSVLTGTVFHGTKIPLRKWVLVIFEMCASKNGVSAREIERKYGMCPRSAWFMMHRIREAMANDGLVATMRGTIVADETWIGGDPGNRHANDRRNGAKPYKPGHHKNTDKTAVLSLIDAGTGEVRSRVVPNVDGGTLAKALAEDVDIAGSVLHTDAWNGYLPVGRQFLAHETVNHAEGEYVSASGAGTNKAENFFSQLKRSLDGTYHAVSTEHLPRYLVEFDYRYSTRKLNDTERMQRLMGQTAGVRLTYKRVTA